MQDLTFYRMKHPIAPEKGSNRRRNVTIHVVNIVPAQHGRILLASTLVQGMRDDTQEQREIRLNIIQTYGASDTNDYELSMTKNQNWSGPNTGFPGSELDGEIEFQSCSVGSFEFVGVVVGRVTNEYDISGGWNRLKRSEPVREPKTNRSLVHKYPCKLKQPYLARTFAYIPNLGTDAM